MPYHHGHLREALVDAALATARSDGPDAVVLRAATRAAGVSPNAAYRHFADREELLAAVAARCMDQLADLMEQRLAGVRRSRDPRQQAWDRLRAAGRAYIDFALDEPGWFRTAFGPCPPAPAPESGRDPYRILNELLDGLVEAGALAPERRPEAEYAAWASVHGIATLLVEGPLRELPAKERPPIIAKVLDSVATGL
ncbi:MAG TPA: TetR/AcrR family transcriptional regulator [Acidimicrobiales bacterium]|nr:TetR/AcrR family transcriptional regulator [Acidimicrobiales bacterium]